MIFKISRKHFGVWLHRDQRTYQAGGIEVETIVTAGNVDTTVTAGGTEVTVESCTTGGSVCTDTLVLTDTEVAVMVLSSCQ